jgi:superfamily I DNA/RNA helicase
VRLPSYQDLSKEQDRINNLPLDGSYLVVGPPGTGKTVMALYRASMLARKRARLAILMHNRLLSQYTSDAAEELDVEAHVDTFAHWLFAFWMGEYRRPYPQIRKYVPDWNCILEKVNEHPPAKGSLAYLIVDEGQDIAPGFYLVAQHLARKLTVFADENQRITEHNSRLLDIEAYSGLTSKHNLTRNYRNTREIAELAQHFYTGLSSGVAELPERSGDRPLLIRHADTDKAVEYITRYEKSNSDRDIGVLVPDRRTRTSLAAKLEGKTKRPIEVFVGGKGSNAKQLSFGEPGIKLLCYHSAKGLEFDTVFMPELQVLKADPGLPQFKMMMYVLISRARDNLYLMYSGRGEPGAVAALPKEYLEIR